MTSVTRPLTDGPDPLRMRVVILAIALIVAGVSTFGYYLRTTVAAVQDNTRRIEAASWLACNDLNAGFSRQNKVIDQAIRQEQARPHPDPSALDALRRFKLPIRDCGPAPTPLPVPRPDVSAR